MVRTSEKLSRRTSRLAYHNLVTSTRGPKSGKNFILCAKISCSCSLSAYSRVTEVQLRTSKARKEGSACVGVGWHSKFPFLGGLVGLLPPGKRGRRRARAERENCQPATSKSVVSDVTCADLLSRNGWATYLVASTKPITSNMGMPLQDPQGGAAHAPSEFAAYSGWARSGRRQQWG